jgi:hypothetical protein
LRFGFETYLQSLYSENVIKFGLILNERERPDFGKMSFWENRVQSCTITFEDKQITFKQINYIKVYLNWTCRICFSLSYFILVTIPLVSSCDDLTLHFILLLRLVVRFCNTKSIGFPYSSNTKSSWIYDLWRALKTSIVASCMLWRPCSKVLRPTFVHFPWKWRLCIRAMR